MERLGIKCKQLMVEEIKGRLNKSDNLFITSFSNIVVPEQEQLRQQLKELDASLLVVKNRLAKQIFEQLNYKTVRSLMQGLTAIAMGGRDAVCVSKALVDFAGKNENFKILGAYVDHELLDFNLVKRLATIPSKEVLFAQIVCAINLPIQGLVTSLSAIIKKLVVVLGKIQEKK